jgi:DNA mismatch repair ATPase MutS
MVAASIITKSSAATHSLETNAELTHAPWVDLRYVREAASLIPADLRSEFDQLCALETYSPEKRGALIKLGQKVHMAMRADAALAEIILTNSRLGYTNAETLLGGRLFVDRESKEIGAIASLQSLLAPSYLSCIPYGDDFKLRKHDFDRARGVHLFSSDFSQPITSNVREETRVAIQELSFKPQIWAALNKFDSAEISGSSKAYSINSIPVEKLEWYRNGIATIQVPLMGLLCNPEVGLGPVFAGGRGWSQDRIDFNVTRFQHTATELASLLQSSESTALNSRTSTIQSWQAEQPNGDRLKEIAQQFASATKGDHVVDLRKGNWGEEVFRIKLASELKKELSELYLAVSNLNYLAAWAEFVSLSQKFNLPVCWSSPVASERADIKFLGIVNPEMVLNRGLTTELTQRSFGQRLKINRSDLQIVPNDLALSDETPVICLAGGNGSGKTTLLTALTNNLIMDARGTVCCADSAVLPKLHLIKLSLDRSLNGDTSSAFQSEMVSLSKDLHDLTARLPGAGTSLAVIDEFGRGTDKRDAVPLMIATVAYLHKHGIKIALSTHFLEIAKKELFQEVGIAARYATMTPDSHKLSDGWAKSGAIEVLAARGMPQEVLDLAIALGKGEAVNLNLSAVNTKVNQNIPAFNSKTLEELRILEKNVGHYSYGSKLCKWAQNLFQSAPWQATWSDENAVAAACKSFMTTNLSDTQAKLRQTSIRLLRDCATLDSQCVDLKALEGFDCLFGLGASVLDLNSASIKLNPDSQRNKTAAIKAFKARFGSKAELLGYLEKVNNFIARSSAWSNFTDELAALNLDLIKLTMSGTFESMKTFAQSEQMDFSDGAILTWFQKFRVNSDSEVKASYDSLLKLNSYYALAVFLRDTPEWTEVSYSENPFDLKVKAASNLNLEQNNKAVTPVDLHFVDGAPVIITGTNGGGKSKSLDTIGELLFCARQIGSVKAERAEIGLAPVRASMTTPKHSSERSSFQAEGDRESEQYQEIVKLNGPAWILIDEPFKGTAPEEGAPVLAAVAVSYSQQGAKLICTSHLYEVFEYFNLLGSAFKVDPRYVELFGDAVYQLKSGIGVSSGIKVAELMGIPSEITEMAKRLQLLLE